MVRLALAITVALTLALGTLVSAHAEISVCYTEPVVHLSNGIVVELGATVHAPASNVQQVTYTVHVPSGVRATAINSSNPSLETVNVVSDGGYTTDVSVALASGSASDSATMHASTLGNASASGTTDASLELTLAS